MRFKWKKTYVYYVLLACCGISLLLSRDSTPLPTWGTLFGFLFLIMIAGDMSWEAFRRQGRACILTSLPPEAGGHSVVHPYDILFATDIKRDIAGNKVKGPGVTLMVFATGGFIHGDFAPQGRENFVVCCPEYVESTVPAIICHARLKRIDFECLPGYVQDELLKLKFFDPSLVRIQRNLWFGMTSKRDGSSTDENLAAESKFLDQNYVINQLKTLLRDRVELSNQPQSKRNDQVVINIPPKG